MQQISTSKIIFAKKKKEKKSIYPLSPSPLRQQINHWGYELRCEQILKAYVISPHNTEQQDTSKQMSGVGCDSFINISSAQESISVPLHLMAFFSVLYEIRVLLENFFIYLFIFFIVE